jgi:hypothetical protein
MSGSASLRASRDPRSFPAHLFDLRRVMNLFMCCVMSCILANTAASQNKMEPPGNSLSGCSCPPQPPCPAKSCGGFLGEQCYSCSQVEDRIAAMGCNVSCNSSLLLQWRAVCPCPPPPSSSSTSASSFSSSASFSASSSNLETSSAVSSASSASNNSSSTNNTSSSSTSSSSNSTSSTSSGGGNSSSTSNGGGSSSSTCPLQGAEGAFAPVYCPHLLPGSTRERTCASVDAFIACERAAITNCAPCYLQTSKILSFDVACDTCSSTKSEWWWSRCDANPPVGCEVCCNLPPANPPWYMGGDGNPPQTTPLPSTGGGGGSSCNCVYNADKPRALNQQACETDIKQSNPGAKNFQWTTNPNDYCQDSVTWTVKANGMDTPDSCLAWFNSASCSGSTP